MPYPNGRYEDAPYHHQNSKGPKSPAPKNGQKALDKSVPVEESNDRIAICDGEIVVLRKTMAGLYHGYISTWQDLPKNMCDALKDNKLVITVAKDKKAKINYDAQCPICHRPEQ